VGFALPLAFMFLASLRFPGLAPPDGFELIPAQATFATYDFVFRFIPLWGQIGNSLVVVAVAVPVTVLVASLAGFALVTSEGRAQRFLIVVTVGAMMVPVSALWVPRAVLFRWLGLTDSLPVLMLPALMGTTPFFVLIFALAYGRIPKDLYAAARLDGWSPFGIWRRVALPLARPATFAVAVLAFVAHWSNFVDPLLYLSDERLATVPLGLRQLQTLEPQNFPILLAASVIATLPAIAAFLIAQRAFFARTLEV
jgi:multiple sugar transport system permease protein